jgi:hypothetical protein
LDLSNSCSWNFRGLNKEWNLQVTSTVRWVAELNLEEVRSSATVGQLGTDIVDIESHRLFSPE